MKEFSNKAFEILKKNFTLVERIEKLQTSPERLISVELKYANNFSTNYHIEIKGVGDSYEILITKIPIPPRINVTVFHGRIDKDNFEFLGDIIKSTCYE